VENKKNKPCLSKNNPGLVNPSIFINFADGSDMVLPGSKKNTGSIFINPKTI